MIRITRMSGHYYGKRVDLTDRDDREDINIFTDEGTPCILVNELEDLENLGIDASEVEMVA